MNREALIHQAVTSAVSIDRQLNLLMDAYDFFVQRYAGVDPSDELQLRDLQVSIKALGELPKSVALQLQAWKEDREPALSRIGFELFVLNEFNLHMHSVATFMVRRGIDMQALDVALIAESFHRLRHTARTITSRLPS